MVKIKICGITNLEDALVVADLGADALGFVFAESPRHVNPEKVKEIAEKLPPFISKVGVFVDETLDQVNKIADLCGLDIVQLHGTESPDYCQKVNAPVIKAFRIKEKKDLEAIPDYQVSAYLLDAYAPELPGGTGQAFDWRIALEAKKYGRPIILSGGLTPENVAQALNLVKPYAVDVSSGVEKKPGQKEHQKLIKFIEAARASRY